MSSDPANANSLSWRDRVTIARFEIIAAAVAISDVVERREGGEQAFDRLARSLQRLRALLELR